MSFVAALLATSPNSTPLARYTAWNGALYLALGAIFYAYPGALQLAGAAPFAANEEGLVRALGAAVAVIGWLYIFGARTRADSFGLATVVDRLAIPVLLVPLVVLGMVDPFLGVPFAVLDPVLGIGAFVIWSRSRTRS